MSEVVQPNALEADSIRCLKAKVNVEGSPGESSGWLNIRVSSVM
jgi:hypothetical protein